jgi:opacity protein-like surface antigen
MRIRAAAVLLATVALSAPAAAAGKKPNRQEDPLAEPRRDPNEAPFMTPKYGGPRPDGTRIYDPSYGEGLDARRNVQLTVKPLFASFPLAFSGRPGALTDPTRGGGAGVDLDVQLYAPFWLRITGTYSGHPVPEAYRRNADMLLVKTANRGTYHATYIGGAVVYAMDFGRILPLLELGAGAMFLRAPEGVVAGQMGGQCVDMALCDPGLRCNVAQNVCQPAPAGAIHFGLGLDVLLGSHWAVGVGLRYFSFFAAPAMYPVYLQAAARLGLRF